MVRQDKRKAQGLSTSALILIALGIIVFALGVFFFTDTVDKGQQVTGSCANLGGNCYNSCADEGLLHNSFGDDSCQAGEQCCVGGERESSEQPPQETEDSTGSADE